MYNIYILIIMYIIRKGENMKLKISDKFLSGFVSSWEVENLATQAKSAFNTVKEGSGAGSDFLGWYDLPVNYDKEEFKRIKIAAKKIQENSQHST